MASLFDMWPTTCVFDFVITISGLNGHVAAAKPIELYKLGSVLFIGTAAKTCATPLAVEVDCRARILLRGQSVNTGYPYGNRTLVESHQGKAVTMARPTSIRSASSPPSRRPSETNA